MNIAASAGSARSSVLRALGALSRRSICLGLLAGALVSVTSRVDAVQLLPGVYGYGLERSSPTSNTAGFGSNAVVVHVTNLGDRTSTGATVTGSLRDAVTKSITNNPPRIVVFDVSGAIKATKYIAVTKSNVTIAGQTAPGPVAIEGAPFVIQGSKVLVQHMRFRAGDEWVVDSTENETFNRDVVQIADTVTNVVFDHCTFAWGLDEMAQGYYAYDNVTFNRCIFAEPLFIATHLDEGTFDPSQALNNPKQAELLSYTTSGISSTQTATNPAILVVDGNYHRINATGANQSIEYTINIPSTSSNRDEEHILISGIAGPDRGKFKVEVRLGTNTTPVQISEEFDMWAATEKPVNYVARSMSAGEFSLGTAATTMKVKVIVTGTSHTGYKLGIDQISLTQPHAMGPYFRDGSDHRSPANVLGGKLSIIGCVFAHLQARGPWVASQNFVLANNIFYNREQKFVMVGVGTTAQGYAAMNGYFAGNTFIEGPDWGTTTTPPINSQQIPTGSSFYLVDNDYKRGTGGTTPAVYNITNSGSAPPTSTAAGMAGFLPLSSSAALTAVLTNAGAWPSQRDSIEQRVVSDISGSVNITDYNQRLGNLKNTILETGGWPTITSVPVTWPEPDPATANNMNGNYTNIELLLQQLATQAETGGAPSTPGTYPAENGTRAGGAVVASDAAGYNGTGFVNFAVGSTGTPSTLTFTGVDGGSGGTKTLRIRNSLLSGTRTGTLTINGTAQSITFNATGAFTTWLNKDVTVTLNSGTSNTIVFAATGQDLANIDEISILSPTTLQAENGTCAGGAVVASDVTGYNGTGFVNFAVGSTGTPSTLTFTSVNGGTGGTKTLRIRNSLLSGTRTGTLTVNGTAQAITFNATGAFSTWLNKDVTVTLNSGSANTIVFAATGQDLANIDEISIL
jgi:hypothetical protein